MDYAHFPNLFLIVGQPDDGKTTISCCFRQQLSCDVLHTDDVYHAWIAQHYPDQYKAAKKDIRAHYAKTPESWRREWNEYLTTTILEYVVKAKLDLVVEGWLLLQLPLDLRHKLDHAANVMVVQMKRFTATACGKSIKPVGRDYKGSVKFLCERMSQLKGTSFMQSLVKYQSFEDIRGFQGVSDSFGKLLALNLPSDLNNKQILDINCNAGYFSIRCAQRGATVLGIDKRQKNVVAATRITSSVYRMTNPRFARCDFFKTQLDQKFDIILAVSILSEIGDRFDEFFEKTNELLNPGGVLVVETKVSAIALDHPKFKIPYIEIVNGRRYPNEHALAEFTKQFKLTYRGRSVRIHGDKRRRVYHLTKV